MPRTSRRDDFFKRGLHRLFAREIRHGSDMVDRAREMVELWEREISPRPVYVDAWKDILSHDDQEVARLITAPTEEMDRWRCSTPFVPNLLDVPTRLRFQKKLRKLAPL